MMVLSRGMWEEVMVSVLGPAHQKPLSLAVHHLLLQLIGFSMSTATLEMIVEEYLTLAL